MTRIIIDDVADIQDLYDALATVTRAFEDPQRFCQEEQRFYKRLPDGSAPQDLAAEPDAPIKPYLPCPQRGTHLRLTDCWACWCDVHRGACLEVDVLAPEAWDLAAKDLLAGSPRAQDE